MRIEFIILILTAFGIAHVYTEGRYIKQIMQHKKYFKMAGVAFGGLFLYYVLKKVSPSRKRELLEMSNEYIKYLPIDRNTSSFISPILDMTKNNYFAAGAAGAGAGAGAFNMGASYPTLAVGGGRPNTIPAAAEIGGGGDGGGLAGRIKRSVGESKKKFVAASQNWKCAMCKQLLPATYQVDHEIALFQGGSNSISNLRALCPSCHSEKTMIERF
jgi:hypothetical protein